jgi:hypothetical protein
MAQTLRLFVLGAKEDSPAYLALSTLASQKPISETALMCHGILKKPFTYVKNFMPEFGRNAVNHIADRFNTSAGEVVGHQLVKVINNQCFEKLKDIQLFSPDQMQLNLTAHALSLPLPEELKFFFEYSDEILGIAMNAENGLDAFVSPHLKNVGTFAANQMLRLMADQLQPILESNNLDYSVADLMTKDVELPETFVNSTIDSAINYVWNWNNSDNGREEI